LKSRHSHISIQDLTEINILTTLLESLAFQGSFLIAPGIPENIGYSSCLLSVFQKFCDLNDQKWISTLKPISASDMDKSQTLPTCIISLLIIATASNSSSLFHQEAKRISHKNIRNLLLYFVYYTESIGNIFSKTKKLEDGIQFAMSINHPKTQGTFVFH
jgi:hypothetical protein